MVWFRKKNRLDEKAPRVAETDRIYAIGDVHGRNDLLLELIDQISLESDRIDDARQSYLLFLGDMIDRGDASRDVLETLMQLRRERNVLLLKGNHEAAMLDFLDDPESGRNWVSFGGQQTLASFGIPTPNRSLGSHELLGIHSDFVDAIRPYLTLFAASTVSHQSGHVFFCHAGVNPHRALEQQSERALLWGHPEGQVPLPVPGWKIVHGHFDNPDPIHTFGRLCIDTGAYYSGVLTAARLDSGETLIQTGA